MPSTTQRDIAPGSSFLNAVRESQAAVLDVVNSWTDIAFRVAEQTLAVQRQVALTVAGAAIRQADDAIGTVLETFDPAVEPVDITEEPRRQPARQDGKDGKDGKVDRRTYEERSVEELRERARELEIEGRSGMSKDELVAALRKQSR